MPTGPAYGLAGGLVVVVQGMALVGDADGVALRVGDGGGYLRVRRRAGDDGQNLPVLLLVCLHVAQDVQLPNVPHPGVGVEASLGGRVGHVVRGRQPRHRNPGGGGGVRAVVHGHDGERPLTRRYRRVGTAVPYLQLRYRPRVEGVGAGGRELVRVVIIVSVDGGVGHFDAQPDGICPQGFQDYEVLGMVCTAIVKWPQ